MPKQRTTRSLTYRSAPYPLRSVSGNTNTSSPPTSTNNNSNNNMAVAVSPMVSLGWDQMPTHAHHHPHYLDAQQQQQYGHYQQQVLLADYSSMPTPLSAAPAVQQVRTPGITVSSSNRHLSNSTSVANGNGGGVPWTAEMDEILIENHRRLKWDQIAEKFFGNHKTGNACRKRYARVIMERKEPARWDVERVQKVINAYNREGMREQIWRALAEASGERWPDVERLCYGQGLKQMTSKHPYGHSRRQSQAASHRSNASINSDIGHNSGYDDLDDDPTDDSGIGNDLQANNYSLHLQPQSYPTATRSLSDGYQQNYSDYRTDPYYG